MGQHVTPAVVIGEGIAGQATALALLAASVPVVLLAREPAAHAESTHRHDGIDAALAEDDSPGRHLDDLVAAAGEPARPFLEPFTEAAPALVEWLERLDIPFERTRRGKLSLSKLAGSTRARSVHAGSATARHVSRRLGALLDKHEATGALERLSGWTLIDLVLDDSGVARGVVAQCFATGELRAIAADGLCLATGGHAGVFMHDTLAPASLGGATGLALRHGARVVDPGRLSLHPFCYRAGGFVRRLPRRLEALGAELDAGLLDLSKIDRAPLRQAAGPALEAHRQATGTDAYSEPVVVTALPDRTLGGLEVSADHATAIPGVYAVGGAISAYFGRATVEGLPLGAALHGARRTAQAIADRRLASSRAGATPLLEAAQKQAEARLSEIVGREGDETVLAVARDLRQRAAKGELGATFEELEARARRARLGDGSLCANAALRLWWDLEPALELGRLLARAEGA
ncbi:MAG: FAD-dependent oxidoreductase [Polyangiaceae bacterium]|nr:FAD-dependent oxidoreductase [Polyangiaceae bacterium]